MTRNDDTPSAAQGRAEGRPTPSCPETVPEAAGDATRPATARSAPPPPGGRAAFWAAVSAGAIRREGAR